MLTTDSKVDSCSTSPYSITIGGRLTLHCPVSGYPPPIVTWMKNRTERQIGEDSKFTIVSAKEEDFGIYSCMATDGENTLVQCNISVMKEIGRYIKIRVLYFCVPVNPLTPGNFGKKMPFETSEAVFRSLSSQK